LQVNEAYPPLLDKDENFDLLVAHIGTITERDLNEPIGMFEENTKTFLSSSTPRFLQNENIGTSKTKDPLQESKKTLIEGQNHLRLGGVFYVIHGLSPQAAIVSEFGEEMKTVWIKAVRAIGDTINSIHTDSKIPVFAGDPMMIYNIKSGEFVCHEDGEFHDPKELRMVSVYERQDRPDQGHPRPYLFTKDESDPSDYEDKIREFHEKWRDRKLPHFK
jgi:hypothetical protein